MSFFLFVILELRPVVWGTQDGINQKHRFKINFQVQNQL